MRQAFVPVLTVVVAIFAIWYVAAIFLNSAWAYDKAKRADVTLSTSQLISDTWSQDKPKLPAPHQVGREIWKTTVEKKITSKRSLIYHSWITLSATLLGFAMGTVFGTLTQPVASRTVISLLASTFSSTAVR